jgi:hypothetical protein
MAKKKPRATDALNVSLAGIESAAAILETMLGDKGEAPPLKGALQALKDHAQQARGHLINVQLHLAQI